MRTEIASSNVIAEMLESSAAKIAFGVSVYCGEDSLRPVTHFIHRFVGSSIKRGLAVHGRKSGFHGLSQSERAAPTKLLLKF